MVPCSASCPPAQCTNVMGLWALYVVRNLCATIGIFLTMGNFSLLLCISITWSRLHSEGLMIAVLMIWIVPGSARWRPAISWYIWPTAPFSVTSRYSLYMLCVFVRLWYLSQMA